VQSSPVQSHTAFCASWALDPAGTSQTLSVIPWTSPGNNSRIKSFSLGRPGKLDFTRIVPRSPGVPQVLACFNRGQIGRVEMEASSAVSVEIPSQREAAQLRVGLMFGLSQDTPNTRRGDNTRQHTSHTLVEEDLHVSLPKRAHDHLFQLMGGWSGW